MSLTPIEIPRIHSTLSDQILSELLTYTKFNGMILGYIAVVLTIRLLGRI